MARCGAGGARADAPGPWASFAGYAKIAGRVVSVTLRNEALRLLFKTLSRAPLWALYALSRVLYLLAYYVARHRHQVIREQLGARSFPSLPEAERTAIHKRFLKNFCDVLVEVVKSLSLAPAEMSARVRIVNLPAAAELLWMRGGRSCS